jgi:hypothetical protein
MLIKVTKSKNSTVTKAKFIFENDADIPLQLLQFIDPDKFRGILKEKKIEALEEIIKATEEELEDAGYPDPVILGKLAFLTEKLEEIKTDTCMCDSCKADINNTHHAENLKDILGANGIQMN